MKILILGGTVFVGRVIVEAALDRNHEVTIFNRGKYRPELYPYVRKIRGDRTADLAMLKGDANTWDAVIDPSGFTPEQVTATAHVLAHRVEHYIFVSTIGVHRPAAASLFDAASDRITGASVYDELKARSEDALAQVWPGRLTITRPGFLVGPYDNTRRFTYWVRRIARGGDVLVPGPAERRLQLIDGRDYGEWLVRLAEGRMTGAYLATGPTEPMTMGQIMEECRVALNPQARLHWVDEGQLIARGVKSFEDLPVWMSEEDPRFGVLRNADITQSVSAGLRFRPFSDTVRDTHRWDRIDGFGPPQVLEGATRTTPITAEPMDYATEQNILADLGLLSTV
jgi:2'-hydroxyisoflavone reductase